MTSWQRRRRRLLNLWILLVAQAWATGQTWLGQPPAADVDRPTLRRREPVAPVLSVKVRRTVAVPADRPPVVSPQAAAPSTTSASPPIGAAPLNPVSPSAAWTGAAPASPALDWPIQGADAPSGDRWAPSSRSSSPATGTPSRSSIRPPAEPAGLALPVQPLGSPPSDEGVRLGEPAYSEPPAIPRPEF